MYSQPDTTDKSTNKLIRGRRRKLMLSGILVIVLAGLTIGVLALRNNDKINMAGMDHSNMAANQSHATYSIKLMSGKTHPAKQLTMVHFAIQDQAGKVLKDFDTVHEKKLHLIVVRKDRTNFQHVHPTLDQNTGVFMIEPFSFPTDGEYRIFTDFTASNAQTGSDGMKLSSVPFVDVKAGDVSKYVPESLGPDKMASDAGGLPTNLRLLSDDSPAANLVAGVPQTLGVSINKAGAPYKNLQEYLGALGHMVVLGPNLEYIHAHALSDDAANQTGLIAFMVTFPDPGQYKIYLQTQSENHVITTDYTVTANPHPAGSSQSGQSMQGMPGMSR